MPAGGHIVSQPNSSEIRQAPRDEAASNPLRSLVREVFLHPRALVLTPLVVAVLGALLALVVPRRYDAEAIFSPASDLTPGLSGSLQSLAAQFGITQMGQGFSVYYFAQIVQSREVLLHVAADTLVADGGRTAVLDLLDIDAKDPLPQRLDQAVRDLSKLIVQSADEKANLVTVRTRAPSPALAVALNRSVIGALDTAITKSVQRGGTAARRFAETQATAAGVNLRAAEDDLRRFLEANRNTSSSPALQFEEGRLRRRVQMAQDLYVALTNQAEAAKLQEVRNTPSIAIVQPPLAEIRRAYPRSSVWGLFGLLGSFSAIVGWLYVVRPFLPEEALLLLAAGRRRLAALTARLGLWPRRRSA